MIGQLLNIDWSQFHFLRESYWFYSIPVLIAIIIGFVLQRESIPWKKSISKHLQPYVISKGNLWKSRRMYLATLVVFTFAFLAFLGPTWKKVEGPKKTVESRFIIALDVSKSMLCEDISPNRLERAKFKIRDLLEANPGAETALLVFSGSTHTAIPFTIDYKIITDQIDGIHPRMMPVPGTGFEALFTTFRKLIPENGATTRFLILTDDLDAFPTDIASNFIQETNAMLYVYPFATKTGATLQGSNNFSLLNTDKAAQLASIQDISMVELTLDKSDVNNVAKDVRTHLSFEEDADEKEEDWDDQGYWLVIPVAALFLLFCRKGWALNAVVLTFAISSCSTKSTLTFKDIWITDDYQAQQLYNAGKFEQAAQKYQNNFNKGTAYFKAGDYSNAARSFQNDTSFNSRYNLGITYVKLGKLEEAQQTFIRLLEERPDDIATKENMQLIDSTIAVLNAMEIEIVSENDASNRAKNKKNDSPEDLSGGGQKATEEDMKKERLEEEVDSEIHRAEELDELPDDFKLDQGQMSKNILLKKIDDDPSLFLRRKFKYQVKFKLVEIQKTSDKW